MTDFLIESLGNGDHDLTITDNDFVIVGNSEDTWAAALRQRILYAVGTWFAESAFDRSVGFPWLEGVFGRQPVDGISALVYQHITRVPGVVGIIESPTLTLDTASRRLTISCRVQGDRFEVPINATISELAP